MIPVWDVNNSFLINMEERQINPICATGFGKVTNRTKSSIITMIRDVESNNTYCLDVPRAITRPDLLYNTSTLHRNIVQAVIFILKLFLRPVY